MILLWLFGCENFLDPSRNRPLEPILEPIVYIDQHLEWKTHVNFIAAKISKSVGLLHKAKYYLPSNSLLTLYYALICPYLTYCNLIWASTYVTNLQRIYQLQKRAVRAISKADYKASSKPLFQIWKFLMFLVYTLSK